MDKNIKRRLVRKLNKRKKQAIAKKRKDNKGKSLLAKYRALHKDYKKVASDPISSFAFKVETGNTVELHVNPKSLTLCIPADQLSQVRTICFQDKAITIYNSGVSPVYITKSVRSEK